jgi:tRNA threonylcarbamoyladenosine biosynthesis protein TsaB
LLLFFKKEVLPQVRFVRVLAISSAYAGCSSALVDDGVIVAEGRLTEQFGLAGALPALIDTVLARQSVDLVAVVVGPGSFTGLRAGISVAAGIGLALGVPVVGVSVTEALAAALPALGGRRLWIATEARRGRVFIDSGAGPVGFANEALPRPAGPVAIAGNAAALVAGTLAAKGRDVMLTSARVPGVLQVAAVGVARAMGRVPPLAAVPLYVDAPEARQPAGGLRAAPV